MAVNTKEVGGAVVGVAIGAGQTYALRTWVDKPGEPWVFKDTDNAKWGQPSALCGIVGGVIGTGLGLAGYLKGIGIRSKPVAATITGYGLGSLAGGLYSGMKPVAAGIPGSKVPQRVPVRLPSAMRVPTLRATATPTGTTTRGLQIAPATKGLTIAPATSNSGITVRSLAQ